MSVLSRDHIMVQTSKMFSLIDGTLLKDGAISSIKGSNPLKKGGCHNSTSPEFKVPSTIKQLG